MNAREEILARARRALDGAPRPPLPEAPTGAGAPGGVPVDLCDRFTARVSDYRAEVHRTAPGRIAETLGGLLADAPTLAVPPGLPPEWLGGYGGDVRTNPDAAGLDAVDAVLTGAAVAIAETGTIVLDAGPAQGRRALTLVPDRHVCVVHADRIVADVPDAVARLGAAAGRRPLTWISGPSATSDIELDRVEGVHGPRRLQVVVVE